MTEPPPATFDDVVRVAARTAVDDVVRVAACATPVASKPPSRIGDVARAAGVSPITVSRALRHPEKLTEATRERVLETISRMGYESNPHARALRSGRSTVIVAFVSNIMSQQFGLAIEGLTAVLEPEGYDLMVGQTSYSYAKEVAMIRSLRSLRPAAVMFTGVIELEENRQALRELAIPVVETWANPRDPIDMLVGFSNMDAGAMAARYLVDRGCRRIGFIGRSAGRGMIRLRGFDAELGRHGMAVSGQVLVPRVDGIDDGRTALAGLLERGSNLDAVFCANDLLAVGALIEARERGLDVPGTLRILGFGDNDVAAQITPGLTTISLDARELGRRAGILLRDRLAGAAASTQQRQNLSVDIIERGSV